MEALTELLTESRLAFAVVAGAIGLLVGSFLNVVIYRLPRIMERQWRADCAEFAGTTPAEPQATYNLITPASACPAWLQMLEHFS